MTDILTWIKDRRSVRKFETTPVSEERLHQIAAAVQWSPSWANTQCWELIVVTQAGIKNRLSETVVPKNPAGPAVANAPVVLALAGKTKSAGYYKGMVTTKFEDWLLFDLGIATQSICLTAHSLGLGSVIVGLFDHDRAKAVLEIPDEYEVAVLIPIGFAAQAPKAPERKAIDHFVHYDRF